MGIIRNITSNYRFYHHQKLNALVAIDESNQQLIKDYYKAQRKKATGKIADSVKGFRFELDEELQTLKIDFSTEQTFKIIDLVATK